MDDTPTTLETKSEIESPDAGRCQALTRAGQRCRNRAMQGSSTCRVHTSPAEIAQADESVDLTPVESIAAAAAPAQEPEPPDEETREQLRAELERLAETVRRLSPGYEPPPFSPLALVKLLEENLRRLSPDLRTGILATLRQSLSGNYLDLDTWKGLWYMLNYTFEYQASTVKRRLQGEYEIDPYGYDEEFYTAIKPLFEFLYQKYWRVDAISIENVPAEGPVLLASHHSGVLPWDGAMIALAMQQAHPSPRMVRVLYANWVPSLPFISLFLTKIGMVVAHPENGERLLNEGELVLVFPEGHKGIGKLFKERYRLARFGRGGFIQLALKTGVPVVPVAVVGAEETYPMLARADWLGRPFGMPFLPITPTWPWLGLLGAIPLPTKWTIHFGEPIQTEQHGPAAADDVALVSQLSDQVRDSIQGMLYERLKRRRSVFLG